MKPNLVLLFGIVTQLSLISSEQKDNLLILGSHFITNANYTFFEIKKDDFTPTTDVFLNGLKVSETPITTKVKKVIETKNLQTMNTFKVQSTTSGSCMEQSVILTRTTDIAHIFIHFVKPIYKTGDKFEFHVFVLDKRMIPFVSKMVDISIIDATGCIVQKFTDAQTNEFGFYNDTVEIANDPSLGKWTIQVEVDGRKVTKMFEVQKYTEGDLEVVIDAQSIVAFDDRKIYMTLYTKSDDGSFVRGNAVISLTARFINSEKIEIKNRIVKKVELKERKTAVVIDIQEEMNIRFTTSDMLLTFEVAVTENYSKKMTKTSKDVTLRCKGKHTIQVVRNKYFKPELKYPIRIKVKTLDGNMDNSFNQLKMTVTLKNGADTIKKNTIDIILKKGETIQVLEPTMDTTNIIIDLKFDESHHKEEISVLPTYGSNQYMIATVISKNKAVGDLARVSVKSTGEMEELHLAIFGHNGIVHTNQYDEPIGKDVYNVSFILTEDMRPEARGLVFFVKPDSGDIVYDDFSISLGLSINNSLEITSDTDVYPKSTAKIQVKTEDESYVFLSAIDSSTKFIDQSNEISRNDIYNELTYYLNLKFPNASAYHFEKLNAFVMNPFKNGWNCDFEEPKVSEVASTSEEIYEAHQYFPEVILSSSKMDGQSSFEQEVTLPDTITSWRVFGISVNRNKGFTVAKVQPEITVTKNDFMLQIEAPFEARIAEIFEVKIKLFNSLNEPVTIPKLNIKLSNGLFIKNNKEVPFDSSTNINLPSKNQPVDAAIFYVKSNNSNNKFLGNFEAIGIDVSFYVNSRKYSAEKTIKVSPHFHDNLILNKDENWLLEESKILTLKNEVKMIYGNLFGPAIDGLEAVFQRPMTLLEEKIVNFEAAVLRYKFMELTPISIDNSLANEKKSKAESDMRKGYQETLPILTKILNMDDNKGLRIAAHITKVLIEAKKYIFYIDESLIEKSLKFIQKHQNEDGSYPYFIDSDNHRADDFSTSHTYVQTAFITETFIRSNLIEYQLTIRKSLDFTKKSKSNYAIAVTAFNFALNNQPIDALNLIKKVSIKPHVYNMSMNFAINSYTIRTKMILKNDVEIEKLLNPHRKFDGSFHSPFSTVLGLHMLYEYAQTRNIQNDDFEFDLNGKNHKINKYEAMQIGDGNDTIKMIKGLGYAVERTKIKMKQPDFITITTNLDDQFKRQMEFDMIIKIVMNDKRPEKNIVKTNLYVIEVELLRGYMYQSYETEGLEIEKFELRPFKNTAVFYVKWLEPNKKYSITIKTVKAFTVKEAKTHTIKVYDYYRSSYVKIDYFIQDLDVKKV